MDRRVRCIEMLEAEVALATIVGVVDAPLLWLPGLSMAAEAAVVWAGAHLWEGRRPMFCLR
ncbi:hypothetical protein A33O_19449 [Nitratireductor aquibiodomus RA22]|uniref:Uncharacterized protein n=1 Tax=Nitratireductor aquibiodomus RA22 TaxID=1189611 RepID=I5BS79_9HYPH|nr:hypothetical protein A33O_19449 [Nitratireductor aquibiodomus RA22]